MALFDGNCTICTGTFFTVDSVSSKYPQYVPMNRKHPPFVAYVASMADTRIKEMTSKRAILGELQVTITV
jgi:hypothetical protein